MENESHKQLNDFEIQTDHLSSNNNNNKENPPNNGFYRTDRPQN